MKRLKLNHLARTKVNREDEKRAKDVVVENEEVVEDVVEEDVRNVGSALSAEEGASQLDRLLLRSLQLRLALANSQLFRNRWKKRSVKVTIFSSQTRKSQPS